MKTRHTRRSSKQVSLHLRRISPTSILTVCHVAKKADEEARKQAQKPGAMKMGQQGIKKGGKK
jgi:hypothetical protein